MRTLLALAHAIDKVHAQVAAGLRWLMLAMVGLGAANAVLRHLAKQLGLAVNSTAMVEGQWYLFSVVFLLGGAPLLARGQHVRVDVFFAGFSGRAKAAIDLVSSVGFAGLFGWLLWWTSWPIVQASWHVHELSPDPGGLPRFPIKAALLVGVALLFAQVGSEAVKALARVVAPPPTSDEAGAP